nr:type II toxin-antitoxin system VapC family toxin [Sphingosinicella soli]
MLDSNTCIYVLEGLSSVLRDRIEARSPGEIVTSAIVYAEVMRGIDPANDVAVAKAMLLFEAFPALPFDAEAARAYAQVPFRRGKFDRLIGAHALAVGLTVVTSNGADFADIPGLKVENWTL